MVVFILSFNGGKVIDLMTDKVLFEQALPPDIVPVLYNRSKEAGLAILSYNGNIIITYEDGSVKIIPAPIMLTAGSADEACGF